MTELELRQPCDQLNNTPRTCFGWKPPDEGFREKMMGGSAGAPAVAGSGRRASSRKHRSGGGEAAFPPGAELHSMQVAPD